MSKNVFNSLFLQHPSAGGETYVQHLLFTVKTGWYLLVTSAALVLHGFVPKFCQTTASDRIIRLVDTLQERSRNVNAGSVK